MITTSRLMVTAMLLLVMPNKARACLCETPSIKEAARTVDIVFRGELVEHKGNAAVFRVDEQWKGNLASYVEVEWRDGSQGDCNGFWPKFLKVGNKLLVFARRGGDGIYRTRICLPVKFLASAEGDPGELGPAEPRRKNQDKTNRNP